MIAEIIIDVSNDKIDRVFDYVIPDNLKVILGQRVLVEFGRRYVEGFVMKIKETSSLDSTKLKPIYAVKDDFSYLDENKFRLISFLTQELNLRTIDVLRLFIPTQIRKDKVKEQFFYNVVLNDSKLLDEELLKLRANAIKMRDFLVYMKNNKKEDKVKLNKTFGSSVINKYIKQGIFREEKIKKIRDPFKDFKFEKKEKVELNELQENAKQRILNSNKPVLLFGVTGSGKTEVYMNAIEEVLKEGKTALFLVPEIGLTPMMYRNFYSRFGDIIAVIHSGLSDGEKFDEWNRIHSREVKIVIGARSALFSPLKNIGIIILDEEHDGSYISDSNPRYDAHFVAEKMAEIYSAKLVFGSATPSIDSFLKAKRQDYELVEMPNRVNKSNLPDFKIVDMMQETRAGNTSLYSRELIKQLEGVIERKEQAILFINRRGYASFVQCKECGYIAKCEDCDVSLVYHKEENILKCHYCNRRYSMLNKCPKCHGDKIKQGYVGTEKVQSELEDIFKGVKVFRMDNDTTTSKNAHINILSEFEKTKPSILVGTQMIAKGHDFPAVTLVGILNADQSLHFSDFRASERTYQLITQVAGRAGRKDLPGQIILQTYSPKHFVYNCAKEYRYNSFFEKEANLREVTKFPPFAVLVRILFTSEEEEYLLMELKNYYNKIKDIKAMYPKNFLYLNVMKAPVKRKQKKFRYQILLRIRVEDKDEIIKKIYEVDNSFMDKKITSFVEINPQNLS